MSDAFILGAATTFLATPFCGVSLESTDIRNEVFAHVEVVKFTHRSTVQTEAILTVVVKCRRMTTLILTRCRGLTALPDRLGDCAALMTLSLMCCEGLTTLPEQLGDCAALTTLDLREWYRLLSHIGVSERLFKGARLWRVAGPLRRLR